MKRIAIASAIVTVLGACAAPAPPAATTGSTQADESSPSAMASPSAGSTPSAAHRVALPTTTWGDWLADIDGIPGLASGAGRIQLSVDWQNGLSAWVQLADGQLVLQSDSLRAEPGELQLVAADGSVSCTPGEAGRYGWNRSADGMFLQLTPIEDGCALRSEALGRTWVHSLGAVNDGGRGVASTAGGTFEITLPDERFAMSGSDGLTDIHSSAGNRLIAVGNPAGYRSPCSTSPALDAFGIEPTIEAFEAYVRGLPGTTVATEERQIDGHAAVRVAISTDASVDCPGGELFVYRPDNADEDADISIAPGSTLSVWAIERPGGVSVLSYRGDDVTLEDEDRVMSTIRFIDALPAK